MAEIAPPGGSGVNRRFLFIVGGLGALLVVGLLALGFVSFGMPLISRLTQQPTATRVAFATATLAPTLTRTPTSAATSAPSATVQVAVAASATPAPPTATPTVLAGGTTTPSAPTESTTQLPQSGSGETFLLLAGGLVLLVIVFVIRRARLAH
ncbi:MAG TPA: LPXTG cell wall anchor domain-containing protein [Anaerolineae bacterium]